MMKSEEKREEGSWLSLKNWSSFILLSVVFINCLICSILISKNVVITQENQILLERLVALSIDKHGFPTTVAATIKPVEMEQPLIPEKLIGEHKYENIEACPPCPTTPAPDPVDIHLTPVGVLNEASYNKAEYDCIHSCVHPVIHKSYLTIDNPCCIGTRWEGTGSSKQAAKHDAAYKALTQKFPNDVIRVSESNIPPAYNPGACQKPPKPMLESMFENFETRKKC